MTTAEFREKILSAEAHRIASVVEGIAAGEYAELVEKLKSGTFAQSATPEQLARLRGMIFRLRSDLKMALDYIDGLGITFTREFDDVRMDFDELGIGTRRFQVTEETEDQILHSMIPVGTVLEVRDFRNRKDVPATVILLPEGAPVGELAVREGEDVVVTLKDLGDKTIPIHEQ